MKFSKRTAIPFLARCMGASAIAVGGILLGVQPASAANCLQDLAGRNLQCTANDVRVAFADNIRDLNGNPLTSCIQGQALSFIADFHVQLSATSRSNIGLYFATDSDPNADGALTGTCSDNVITPLRPASPGSSVIVGSSQYTEIDASSTPGDSCGDITTATSPQTVTVEVDNVICQAAAGTNQLKLPNCTSWQQPGSVTLCQIAGTTGTQAVSQPLPGSPSKCNCNAGFTVPITVQTGNISATKTPTPSSLPYPGGSVTYTVTVTNNFNVGGVTINQICDDQFGNVMTATTSPAQTPCPAGKLGSITGTDCALPHDLVNPNDTYTCTFTANLSGEETTITDKVTINGITDQTKQPVTTNASAMVTIGDAPAAAELIKSVDNSFGCAIVRYTVDVHNTSGGTTDEVETLSALNDSHFGSITQVQGDVLGTTCGVATGSPGLGTLSGSTGAGALGSIAVGSHYICQFDGKFCGNIASGCLENADTVTPVLTGDEPGQAVTTTTSPLTVDVCFSSHY